MSVTNFQAAYHVGSDSLEEYSAESTEEILADPRGLLLCWEPPDPHATYIMGGDPSVGITGWSRATRADGDHKTDNSALEIFKVDGVGELQYELDEHGVRVPSVDPITKRPKILYRDVQVAEFAAPCDSVEFARIANLMGRIYSGTADDQCEFIFESYPGPGLLSTQELLRLSYGNLWMWERFADSVAESTTSIGWHSTRESQKALWYRARRHLLSRRAIIRSRFLLDEYANAEIDLEKMRARASYGYHDDRFMAANLCFWGGHKWTYDPERTEIPVLATPVLNHQTFAPVLGEDIPSWKDEARSFFDRD